MSSADSRTTIIVALIGVLSATVVAVISNFDKIWPRDRVVSDSVTPQPIPHPRPTGGEVNRERSAATLALDNVIKSLRNFADFRSDSATIEDAERMLLKAGLTRVSIDRRSQVVTGQVDDTLSISLWPGSDNQKNVFGVRYGTRSPSSDWEATKFTVVIPVAARAP